MSRLLAALAALLVLGTGLAPAHAAPAWTWPLSPQPQVTSPFGLGPTVYSAGHRGADLAGEPGQTVLAAGTGRVTYAGRLAGRGVVTVTHGMLRTTYEPVTGTVRVGARVALGEQLGTLEPGHEGCPVAACLHWGLKRGDTYLDPIRLVQQGPVRLLTPGQASVGNRAAAAAEAASASQVTAVGNRPLLSSVAEDREPGARGSRSAAAREPPDRRLAGGLTAGAAVLAVAGVGSTVRRRATGSRSSGVGR